MAMLEERVAYLEGQVNEQSQAFVALRESLGRFEQRVDARFDALKDRESPAQYRVKRTLDELLASLGD